VQRDEALQLLPEAHRRALIWLDEGRDEMDIAIGLKIDPMSVPSLVVIAQHKLERLLDEDDPSTDSALGSKGEGSCTSGSALEARGLARDDAPDDY
jgi:hypothetical protein